MFERDAKNHNKIFKIEQKKQKDKIELRIWLNYVNMLMRGL